MRKEWKVKISEREKKIRQGDKYEQKVGERKKKKRDRGRETDKDRKTD